MKCIVCKYEKDCKLREIAPDLTGCTGHSKERAKLKNEVKCSTCKEWVDEKKAFKHKDADRYICFKCY